MFIEFILARWAGLDPGRPLKERRRSLRRAIVLRDRMGLPVATNLERIRARKAHRKIDALARELDRVEQTMAQEGQLPRRSAAKPAD